MIDKKVFGLVLAGLFFSLFASCKLNAQEQPDFDFEARIVTEEGKEFYDIAGMELYFGNYSGKTVEKFQISFQLFDETGMPFNKGIYEVVGNTNHNEYCHIFLKLDELFNNQDPKKCTLDYMFINKIIYTDGTEYNDPHGLKHFLKLGA